MADGESATLKNKIVVKVIFTNGTAYKFRLKNSKPLQRLIDGVAERFKISATSIELYFNEVRIRSTDTSISLGLIDGDKIYAAIPNQSNQQNGSHATTLLKTEPGTELKLNPLHERILKNQPIILLKRLTENIMEEASVSATEIMAEEADTSINENTEIPTMKRKNDEPLESDSKIRKVIPSTSAEKTDSMDEITARKEQAGIAVEWLECNVNEMTVHDDEINNLIEKHRQTIERMEMTYSDELTKIHEEHRLEMERTVLCYDEEKRILLETNAEAMEQIKDIHNNELNTLIELNRQNLEQIQSDFDIEKVRIVESLNNTIERLKQDHRTEISALNETHRKDLEKAVNELKNENARLVEVMELTKQKQQNEIDILNETHRLALEQTASVCECDKDETVHSVEENSQIVNCLKNELAEQKQRFANEKEEMKRIHHENLTNILKQHEQKRLADIELFENKIRSYQTKLNSQEVKDLKIKLRDTEKRCEELQQLKRQNEMERADLIAKAQNGARDQEIVHSDVIRKLKERHQDAMKVVHDECHELEKSLKKEKSKYDSDMKVLKETHIRAITKIRHQNDADKTEMLNELTALKENNNNSKEQQLLKTLKEHAREIDLLKAQLHSESVRAHNFQQLYVNGQTEIEAFKLEVNQLKGSNAVIKAEHEKQLWSVQNSNIELNKQNAELTEQLTKLKDEFNQKLDELNEENANHCRDIEVSNKAHSTSIQRLQQKCDDYNDALKRAVEHKADEIKRLDDNHKEALKRECDKMNEMNKIHNELRESAHRHEIAELKEKHNKEIDGIRQSMQTILDGTPETVQNPLKTNVNVPGERSSMDGSSSSPSQSTIPTHQMENKKRACSHCGARARFVNSYSYCGRECHVSYCLRKSKQLIETTAANEN